MRSVTLGPMTGAVLRMAAATLLPEREQRRLARQFGLVRGGSGGSIRRALNLRGLVAYNYYAEPSERRAAKALRRARRAS